MDAVLIPVRVRPRVAGTRRPQARPEVRERRILHQPVGDIDAETVGAALIPEPQDRFELGADLRVAPVQVGLLGREQVEVPLPGLPVRFHDPGPGRSTEDALPVRRWLASAPPAALAEEVAQTLRTAGAGRQRVDEPGMPVRRVVGHDVEQDPEAKLVRLGDQGVGIGQRPEQRIDVAVVGHVVATVGHRGGEPGIDPDRRPRPGRAGTAIATGLPAMSPIPSPSPSAKLRM